MGRPTKYTPERATKLIAGLRVGMTRRAAIGQAGISDETFARWLRRSVGFVEQVTQAENEAEAHYTEALAKAAKTDWRAAMEWLKRRRRADWGDQQEAPEKDGAVVVIIGEDLKRVQTSDTQLKLTRLLPPHQGQEQG